MDLNEKAINFAASRNENISFICGDVFDSHITSNDSFDVVTVLACLEHLTDPMKTYFFLSSFMPPAFF